MVAPALDEEYRRVPLNSLRVGSRLRTPIYAEDSPLLLVAAGKRLSTTHLDKLRQRNVNYVRIGPADLALVKDFDVTTYAKQSLRRHRVTLEQAPPEVYNTRWSGGSGAFERQRKKPRDVADWSKLLPEISAKFQQSIVDVTCAFREIALEGKPDGRVILQSTQAALQEITADMDLFLLPGMQAQVDKYPFCHSLQVARLAMAIGTTLEMDADTLKELGAGCLVHDLGMLRLDPGLINCERPLDRIERLDITKHPTLTFGMIQHIYELSFGSKMVAYQMHERLDGSGYPRARQAFQIHPLSRIAMVADVFVAMTSPRPHRPAVLPYYTMVELLEAVNAGKFDADAVRGLLHTVSLFPIGSCVEISDGRVGTVLRSNGELYTRPIIEVWPLGNHDQSEVLDLTQRVDVAIIKPLTAA